MMLPVPLFVALYLGLLVFAVASGYVLGFVDGMLGRKFAHQARRVLRWARAHL
jgi:hypothetical protein